MASPNFSELATTTLRNYSGKMADNFTNNNAIVRRLNESGSLQTAHGGQTILQELEYQANASFNWFTGYDTVSITPSDVMSAAEFDWKMASVAVTASGLEIDVQNVGKEQIHNLLKARIKNAEKTMKNQMASSMYSDGTGSSSKEIGGLQLLVADDPTSGTVGGINRATWTFWQNQTYDASSDGGAAASAANIQTYMNRLYYELTRGNEAPDLILSDNNYYGFYEDSLQAIQRVTNPKLADAGFVTLKYKGSDVVLDGGKGGACPTNHMYMINSEYLKLRPSKNRNMTPLERVQSINQDAFVQLITWAGNMTNANSAASGVLKA
jgi:hypothetical protein